MSEEGHDALGRFVGGLILAVGLLIALLSGACTLAVAGPSLLGVLRGESGAGGGIVLALIFGAAPFAGGVALVLLGWSIVRPRRRPKVQVFDDRPPSA